MNEKVEEFGRVLKELCERLHVDFRINEDGIILLFDSDEYNGLPIEFEKPKTESEIAREESIKGLMKIVDELKIELSHEDDEERRKELEHRIEFLERNM